jgi:protein TonB
MRVGGDIKQPTLMHKVEPTYPTMARTAKIAGMVIIEATIAKDGTVKDAKVLKSVPLLDEPALAAVRQWRYTPTTLGGVPIEVLLIVTVNFQLK